MLTAVWIIVVALVVNCITNLYGKIQSVRRWKQQHGEWTADRIHIRTKFDQLTDEMREHIECDHKE